MNEIVFRAGAWCCPGLLGAAWSCVGPVRRVCKVVRGSFQLELSAWTKKSQTHTQLRQTITAPSDATDLEAALVQFFARMGVVGEQRRLVRSL